MKMLWMALIVLTLSALGHAQCQSRFTIGSGINSLAFCVSALGNVNEISTSAGNLIVNEGYGICRTDDPTSWYDIGASAQGWGDAIVTQPNGINTFPLTITRTTMDGILTLSQAYRWGSGHQGVHVTMTMQSMTYGQFSLVRYASVTTPNENGDHTMHSGFAWGGGVGLMASPAVTPHVSVEIADASQTSDPCNPAIVATPFAGPAAIVVRWSNPTPPKKFTVGMDYRPLP